MALDAVNVGGPIRRTASTLTFPDHLPQAFHGFMMGMVQRIASRRQQFYGLANAARLVNTALLTDGQVHRQVQKGVGLACVFVGHFQQCGVHVRQLCVVLGVFVNPQAGDGFYRFHGLVGSRFGIGGAKKSANIGLRGLKQHKPDCRLGANITPPIVLINP